MMIANQVPPLLIFLKYIWTHQMTTPLATKRLIHNAHSLLLSDIVVEMIQPLLTGGI